MQPQMNNTGNGGDRSVGQQQLSTSGNAASAGVPPHATQQTPQSVGAPAHEAWVHEAEQIIGQSNQGPKQKVDAMSALKQRYQEQVLGLRPPNKGASR